MLTGCLSLSAAACNSSEEKALQFNKDGKFTILNLSDIQDGYPMHSLTKDYIEATVDKVQPDLIVLTGDNISGYDVHSKEDATLAIREFMDIFEEKGIKVAAAFGNHDDEETELTKEEQLAVYESYSCYVDKKGFFIFFYKQPARDFRPFLRRCKQAENPYWRQGRSNGHRQTHIQAVCRDKLHCHQEISLFFR